MRPALDATAQRRLDRWLAERMGAGDIVEIDGILVDALALARPRFACTPAVCTPGLRRPGALSCCADIDVPVSAREQRAIRRRHELVASTLRTRDRRWRREVPEAFAVAEDGRTYLTRPGRRCVFAFTTPGGLRCGLHAAAVENDLPVAALKPESCRLFPLAIVARGRRKILTASIGDVASALGGIPDAALACVSRSAVRRDVPPLYVSCRETIEELFGAGFYRHLHARLTSGR